MQSFALLPHTSLGKCVYLIVYVGDIVIKGNDAIKNNSAEATFLQTLSNQRS